MTHLKDSHALIGYLYGDALIDAFHRGKKGSPLTRTLKINDELWHCHSPDGIDFLLEKELSRTGRSAFDVLFLADPQILEPAVASREKYREALLESLDACKKLADRGLIRRYGFSARNLSDLLPTLEILKPDSYAGASAVSTEFSIFSPDLNLLDQCSGLDFFVRRTLEPIIGDRRVHLRSGATIAADAVDSRILLERIAATLRELKSLEPRMNAPWPTRIETQLFDIGDGDTWERIRSEQIEPSIRRLSKEIVTPLAACLDSISTYFATLEHEQRRQIEARLSDIVEGPRPLADKTLALLSGYARFSSISLSFDLDPSAQSVLENPESAEFIHALSPAFATSALREFFL